MCCALWSEIWFEVHQVFISKKVYNSPIYTSILHINSIGWKIRKQLAKKRTNHSIIKLLLMLLLWIWWTFCIPNFKSHRFSISNDLVSTSLMTFLWLKLSSRIQINAALGLVCVAVEERTSLLALLYFTDKRTDVCSRPLCSYSDTLPRK